MSKRPSGVPAPDLCLVDLESLPLPQILAEISMEQELLEMAAQWRTTAQEMIAKSEAGSRSEMVNQMLMACAQILEWKINTRRDIPHP